MDEQTFAFKAGIRAEIVDGEGVVISFETGKYHGGFGGAAADVIAALMRGPVALADITWALHGRYARLDEEQSAVEVRGFFGRLTDEAIVQPAGHALPIEFTGPARPDGFVFGFESHGELADIITLDPVHEVSPAGWPTRAPG